VADQSETMRQVEDQRRRVLEETDRLAREQAAASAAAQASRAAEEWK
jgi:hypothetical protein